MYEKSRSGIPEFETPVCRYEKNAVRPNPRSGTLTPAEDGQPRKGDAEGAASDSPTGRSSADSAAETNDAQPRKETPLLLRAAAGGHVEVCVRMRMKGCIESPPNCERLFLGSIDAEFCK